MKRRSKKIAIEQTPSGKLDKIKSILAVLLFIALLSTHLFPHVGIRYELGLAMLGNLFFLYDGIKKVVGARKSRQRILWYKEPGILYGLAVLLGVLPQFLLDNFFIPNDSSVKDIGDIVFIVVMLIFLLPAGYFYLKGKMQSHQGSKRVGQLVLLGQSRRSGPQPKEARENEEDPVGLEHG